MTKDVSFGDEAMKKMLKGLDKAAEAVNGTLGPKGLNVFIDGGIPKITNDGATIANEVVLSDKLENAGAYIIRNTSSQTNDDVGDGTTTTSVLVQALVHECLKRPENPMEIKESLKVAGDKILKILAKKSIKIKKEDIEKVALIASENKELAKLITEIINKLGEKAVINVEDSKTFATEYEIVDGYEAHVGFISPHFINDKKSGRAIYENIYVLVSEKKISNVQDIAPVFELFKKELISSCVIVCDDIEDSMIGMFVVNKNIGSFNTLIVRASGSLLKDIEGAVGARAVSDANGVTFGNIQLEDLGKAKKIVCDANKTLFLGNSIRTQLYAETLEKQAEAEPNMYVAKKLRERIAKLRGGVAVLKVGAPTDFERDYLRLKAEDAVKAVQAALEEGVVEGGGMTFWKIAQEMDPKTPGEEILKKALTSPLKKIIENSGKDYAEIIKEMPDGQGYDAKLDRYTNLLESGIIDPSKVERCVLENAVSAASTFITTAAIITEHEEKDK